MTKNEKKLLEWYREMLKLGKNYEYLVIRPEFTSVNYKGCIEYPDDPERRKYSPVTSSFYSPASGITLRIKDENTTKLD